MLLKTSLDSDVWWRVTFATKRAADARYWMGPQDIEVGNHIELAWKETCLALGDYDHDVD